MNLVTIDNNRLWSKKNKNLLLGDWCIDNKHRYLKSKKNKYLISEYHWNNKLKYQNDIKYLYKIYDILLNNLYLYLNKVHGLNHPIRYWEILLSKWLWTFTVMTYDRWEIVRTLNNKKLYAKIFCYERKRFIPHDAFEFARSIVSSDDWNHWVYSEIFRFTNKITFSEVGNKKIIPKFIYNQEEFKSDNYLLNPISTFLSSKKIFSQKLNFSKKFKALYGIFYRQIRYSKKINTQNFNIKLNMEARNNFKIKTKKNDNFLKFIASLVRFNLPKIYLEYYHSMNESIKKINVPKNPKIIMTSGDHAYNDAFKFYTAKKVLNGSKFFIFQHGGLYGTCESSPNEKFEIKIADRFFSWGWKESNKKVYPLFLQKTIYQKIEKKNNAKGLIIPITEYDLAPGTHSNAGQPTNKIDVNRYIDNIVSFVKGIDNKIISESGFKYLDNIKCNYHVDSLKYRFPNIKIVDTIKNTCLLSKNYKLTVETVNSTGFLESLNLNIPVILLLDKKLFPLRKTAVKDFNMLKKVKIVYDSPEDAAKFINENYNHLKEWWGSKGLQKARAKFCYRFARPSTSPMKDLRKALFYGK